MKFGLSIFVVLVTIVMFNYNPLPATAIGLSFLFGYELFVRAGKTLAFREFMLTLYGINYLFSPALTYHMPQDSGVYMMRIPEDKYFELAIPAMLLLRVGLFAIKTNIFSFNYNVIQIQALTNQRVLKSWLIVGMLLSLAETFLPGELGFFIYLLSMVRFVAVFSLFALDRKKYRWWLLLVLFLELSRSVSQGMFHDMVMWLIFFGLFWTYLSNPSPLRKILISGTAIFAFFILQISKNEYRQQTWKAGRDGSFSLLQKVAVQNVATDRALFSDENISGSITRVNQAWILSSTIRNMDYRKNFQDLHLVGLYVESALLPRFIAPNKLTSGNKEIFNKFSGHKIAGGTSMGLGIFADGYIAFGYWGTLIFGLILGLMFGVVFKVIERWAEISPFFVLFIFPVLNYAVRPDCETQTIIGHLVKSLVVFGAMMFFYRKYFAKKVYIFRKKEEKLALQSLPLS